MSLRFFADQCISNFIIDTLQAADHKVFRLKEHIPPDSPDSIVIQKAKELDSILFSLNGDFADIVTYPPSHYTKRVPQFLLDTAGTGSVYYRHGSLWPGIFGGSFGSCAAESAI